MADTLIVSVSGLRGVVGASLTPDVAAGLRDRLARRGEQRSAGL